jgi:hypothetical protein
VTTAELGGPSAQSGGASALAARAARSLARLDALSPGDAAALLRRCPVARAALVDRARFTGRFGVPTFYGDTPSALLALLARAPDPRVESSVAADPGTPAPVLLPRAQRGGSAPPRPDG